MAALVQLEAHDILGNACLRQGAPERDRAEVEIELVVAARVDPDRAHAAQRLRVARFARHQDGIPGEPPGPYLLAHFCGLEVEMQLSSRVCGRHLPDVQQWVVAGLREGRSARAEVLPEPLAAARVR